MIGGFNIDSMIQLLNEASDTGVSYAGEEARRAADRYFEQIQRAFTAPFADDALAAFWKVAEAENDACFARGFRLGARLTLEALTEP